MSHADMISPNKLNKNNKRKLSGFDHINDSDRAQLSLRGRAWGGRGGGRGRGVADNDKPKRLEDKRLMPKMFRTPELPRIDTIDDGVSKKIRDVGSISKVVIIGLVDSLRSYDNMKYNSACNIINTEPAGKGSVNDPRMGSVGDTKLDGTEVVVCSTCGKQSCFGHMGLIDFNLDYPENLDNLIVVPNPLLIPQIVDVLSVVCISCHRLRIGVDYIKKHGLANVKGYGRVRKIKDSIKSDVKFCCHSPLKPSYHRGRAKHLSHCINVTYQSQTSKTPHLLSHVEIFKIFNQLTMSEAEILGLEHGGHPRDMYLRGVMVTPNRQRMPKFDEAKNTTTPDPMTLKFIEVLRKLKTVKESTDDHRAGALSGLFCAVKDLMEVNSDKKAGGPGQQTRNVSAGEQLTGKSHHFRSQMLSKRIGFTGRSVLTADADIKCGQIRLPAFIGIEVGRAIRVYNRNKKQLEDLLMDGKVTYVMKYHHGVKKLITVSKNVKIVLDMGDIVYRNRVDGDFVVFNRQPTLHRYSMQAYESVMDTLGARLSIGMFPSSDEPHHADHDGDEGNLHFPQGLEEEAECKYLMNTVYNMMDRGTHKPSIATIMDTLTGSHLLSYFDQIFRLSDAMAMLNIIDVNMDINAHIKNMRHYGLHPFSGRAVFSAILPRNLNGKRKLFQYKHAGITIVDSVLLRSTITKDDDGILSFYKHSESLTSSHLGTSHRSIIQDIHKQYGAVATANFITILFKVITYYMSNVQDISAGIMDCISRVPGRTHKLVNNKITDILLHIESMGPLPSKNDTVAYSQYQQQLSRILDTADALGIKLVEDVLKDNSSLGHMLKGFGSGAKGTKENIAQIEGALSQQHMNGKRPEFPKTGPRRCLNFFEEGERPLDIKSRGFVTSSFIDGLQPDEFFMHATSSREGITASKTATPESGDLQRKMVNFFQNLIIQYDGTVRNSNGRIVQMMYADGFDSERVMEVKMSKDKNSRVNFIDPHIEIRNANSKFGWILIDENTL